MLCNVNHVLTVLQLVQFVVLEFNDLKRLLSVSVKKGIMIYNSKHMIVYLVKNNVKVVLSMKYVQLVYPNIIEY